MNTLMSSAKQLAQVNNSDSYRTRKSREHLQQCLANSATPAQLQKAVEAVQFGMEMDADRHLEYALENRE